MQQFPRSLPQGVVFFQHAHQSSIGPTTPARPRSEEILLQGFLIGHLPMAHRNSTRYHSLSAPRSIVFYKAFLFQCTKRMQT